ncbi:MAG: O-antigen ligase family protein [Myxococcales bacterium]|nr:O-antigen ligase family protein [Myxococcales bacterium]
MSKYGPALLLFLLPFAYDPWALDVLTAKYIAWVCGVGLWSSLWLWKKGCPKQTLWALVGLGLCFLPSLLRGPSWAHTWVPWTQAFALLWWGLLLWDVLQQESSAKQRKHLTETWFTAVAWGLSLLSVIALLERWFPSVIPWGVAVSGLSNATMGNPNHLGALLSVGVPIFFVLGGKALWGLPLVLGGLAMTGSRLSLTTAYTSLLVGGLVSLLWGDRKRIQEHLRVSSWAFLGAIGLWIFASISTPQKQLTQVNQGRGGLRARLHLLRCAAPMTKEAIPWGVGYGRFRQHFPTYRGQCLKGTVFAKAPIHTIAIHLHNDWVELFLEGGLLILPLLLWLLWWWLKQFLWSWRQLRAPAPQKEDGLSSQQPLWLLLCILGLFLQMGGTFPLQLPSVVALASACFVIVQFHNPLALFPRRTRQAIKSPHPTEESAKQESSAFSRVACLALWLVWLVVIFFSVRILRAEHLLVQGMRAMEQQDPQAEGLLRQSDALHPNENVAFQLGQILLAHEKTVEAIQKLEQAFAILPDVQVALTIAEAYVILRDVKNARLWLQTGLYLQPQHQETLRLLKRLPPLQPSRWPSSRPTSPPHSTATSLPRSHPIP